MVFILPWLAFALPPVQVRIFRGLSEGFHLCSVGLTLPPIRQDFSFVFFILLSMHLTIFSFICTIFISPPLFLFSIYFLLSVPPHTFLLSNIPSLLLLYSFLPLIHIPRRLILFPYHHHLVNLHASFDLSSTSDSLLVLSVWLGKGERQFLSRLNLC